MEFRFRNVNDAFRDLVGGIHDGSVPTVRSSSRAGDVMKVPEPVTITYERPTERVLFNAARDANPFFLLYESLWMLAGRNDVAGPAYYNPNVERVASDGLPTFNGAYGHRWRNRYYSVGEPAPGPMAGVFKVDQLALIVDHLREDPTSRRAVLQMWNVEDDLLRVDTSRDVCCNLCVCFSLRDVEQKTGPGITLVPGMGDQAISGTLDMTVFNRSNDVVWGTLGSDYATFSFLQEYVAARLGVGVGLYRQVSNDLHVYLSHWRPEEWLADVRQGLSLSPDYDCERTLCSNPLITFVPLVADPERFDRECAALVDDVELATPAEPFLRDVAKPALMAFRRHKARDYEHAALWLDEIVSDDWRVACQRWIEPRRMNWEHRVERLAGGEA